MINSDKQKEAKIGIFGQSYFAQNKQVVLNQEFLLNWLNFKNFTTTISKIQKNIFGMLRLKIPICHKWEEKLLWYQGPVFTEMQEPT